MSDSASFNVAVAAAVLAAGAFVIVTLQATLEYLSSGPRHKCTAAAIGYTSKQVKIRWSWSNWRLKVKYPLLDLDWVAILQLAQEDDINNDHNIKEITKEHDNWFWRPVEIDDKLRQSNVADDLTILVGHIRDRSDGEESVVVKPITFKHLNLNEKFRFLYYRIRHNLRPLERPRASWAQLLIAFGVRDTKNLRLRMVDADTVSSALDAPIQRVKLRSLGYLAHILGFTKVTIDVAERRFTALCPRGTITTIEVSNLGKVVRFEGDILAIHALVSRTVPIEIYRAAFMVNGKPSFGKYVANGLYLSLETLVRAIKEQWPTIKWDREMRQVIVNNARKFFVGPIAREARIMNIITKKSLKSRQDFNGSQNPVDSNHTKTVRDEYGHKDSTDWSKLIMNTVTAKWQDVTKLTIPTLYISSTFLTFHSVVSGFPSSILIQPFLPWMQGRARRMYERKGQAFYCSSILPSAIAEQQIGFARPWSDYLMSTGGGSVGGLFGWGIMSMREVFDKCPKNIQDELLPNLEARDAQALLTAETCHLLKHFEVQGWASSVKETQRDSIMTYNPINLLWIQINLLDVAIQILIRGKWNDGKDNETSQDYSATEVAGVRPQTSPLPTTEIDPSKTTDMIPESEPATDQLQIQPLPSSTVRPHMTGSPELQESLPNPAQGPSNPRPTGLTFVESTTRTEQSSGIQSTPKAFVYRPQQPESDRDTSNGPPSKKTNETTGSALPPKGVEITPINIPHPALSRNNTSDGFPKLERKPTIIPDERVDDKSHKDTILVENFGTIEADVVAAIVKSWRKQPSQSTPASPVEPVAADDNDEDIDLNPKDSATETEEWQLAEALCSYSGLTFGTQDEQVRKDKFQKLADFLELRALFMIALLVLHPDSSDTYSIEGEDIEMPMA